MMEPTAMKNKVLRNCFDAHVLHISPLEIRFPQFLHLSAIFRSAARARLSMLSDFSLTGSSFPVVICPQWGQRNIPSDIVERQVPHWTIFFSEEDCAGLE